MKADASERSRAHPSRLLLAVTAPQSLTLMTGLPGHLHSKSWDVHLVVGSAVPGVPGSRNHLVPMTREPSPVKDLVSLWRWLVVLRAVRPQVVLIGTPKAALLGLIAAMICRVPYRVYHLRGLRLETERGAKRRLLTALERLTMRSATQILAVSPSLVSASTTLRLAPAEKFTVLGAGSSNGVDLQRFSATTTAGRAVACRMLGIDPGTPVVGYVGRMTPDKGLDVLVEAALAASESQSFQMLFVGDDEAPGYANALLTRLENAGVTATRLQAVRDVVPVYRAMDLLCLPSLREGFPNVVLEASASGLPVVTTTATGCRDAVQHGVTGWLVPPGDERELTARLVSLLASPQARREMGCAGRAWVERDFDRKKVWEEIDQYLRAATARQTHAPKTRGSSR